MKYYYLIISVAEIGYSVTALWHVLEGTWLPWWDYGTTIAMVGLWNYSKYNSYSLFFALIINKRWMSNLYFWFYWYKIAFMAIQWNNTGKGVLSSDSSFQQYVGTLHLLNVYVQSSSWLLLSYWPLLPSRPAFWTPLVTCIDQPFLSLEELWEASWSGQTGRSGQFPCPIHRQRICS